MRVETMRAVDRMLGRPLAWLLTRLRRISPERRPPRPAEVQRVLFVKLAEMGALVLATPAVAEARRLFPNAERWLLCFEENAEIAEVAAGFAPERVIRVRTGGVFGTLAGLLRAVRLARKRRFDVVVDLEYFSRVGAVLTYLTGAPTRCGFHRFAAEGLYCGDLYTHRATFNPYLHIAQSMAVLVQAAAADPGHTPLPKERPPALDELELPTFEASDDDVAAVRAKLAAGGVPAGADVLLVNPNSSDLLPLRRWPEDSFVRLCRLLTEQHPDAWIVLTGAGHERAIGERVLAALGGGARVASLIGETSLRELLTLFTLSRVLVSADSGPPHFAALTDVAGVTLFGPETPALYGPVTGRNRALSAGLACSPCISAWNRRVSTCTDNQCMQRITPEQVADAVRDALTASLCE